ncbi:MAG: ribonuclease HII [Kiloniellales bacterium]
MPDFALEKELGAATGGAGPIILGVDEAGRGPWAGPVVAAAVWLDPARCPEKLLTRLDDSKVLSAALRARLYAELRDCAENGGAALGIGQAGVAEIDEHNILQATLLAMGRAVAALEQRAGIRAQAALIDGNQTPALSCPARAVVKGDSRSLSIAAASVMAKVTRDRLMEDLAEAHPGYGWERNRGYGTAEHRRALSDLGVTAQHRRSFRPVRELLTIS